MIFGIPGLSTIFYIFSVLAMPMTELSRTARGLSTPRRWRAIVRHSALVAVIVTCVWLVSENHPVIGALRQGGALHDVWAWAAKGSLALMVLLALLPWLARALRAAYHGLGWACAHSRHPHPARPHPSVLARLCPDCGKLMFHAQGMPSKPSLPMVPAVVEEA
ncbi:hypothetical protein [Streptomyces sp. MB09-02B]|uniref:hypothetical protein n=1 Tax=Streptomyces sp. MB09-02B TaxID=3028667 RepID=UPI0029A49C63|nr:hypothetical protein [Streptomyces sp. MB09-02B]MDX3640320.1 hypothetical protein [Streptomyces sp. MB09-02B]